MSQQEKYEIPFCIAFGIILYLLTKRVAFALCLPVGAFVFYFLARRASGADWQVRLNTEEAHYRKPQAPRIFSGAMALIWVALFVMTCYMSTTPGGRPYVSLAPFSLIVFVLLALLSAWNAGPMETRFDFLRRRVRYRVGFPLFARWQIRDAADIANLRVLSSSRSTFMTIHWKTRRGLTAATHVSIKSGYSGWATGGPQEAREETLAAAEQIGERLGLSVEVQQIGQF